MKVGHGSTGWQDGSGVCQGVTMEAWLGILKMEWDEGILMRLSHDSMTCWVTAQMNQGGHPHSNQHRLSDLRESEKAMRQPNMGWRMYSSGCHGLSEYGLDEEGRHPHRGGRSKWRMISNRRYQSNKFYILSIMEAKFSPLVLQRWKGRQLEWTLWRCTRVGGVGMNEFLKHVEIEI
jgi:hypothetical protein